MPFCSTNGLRNALTGEPGLPYDVRPRKIGGPEKWAGMLLIAGSSLRERLTLIGSGGGEFTTQILLSRTERQLSEKIFEVTGLHASLCYD